MTQIEDNYALLSALARQSARSVGRDFLIVSYDDLVQECWLWARTHPGKLGEYLAIEDEKHRERTIVTAFQNACRDYARKERAARNGGDISDDAWYRHEELKALLPAMFDRTAWLNPPKPEAKVKGGDPSEGNNWITKLSDVRRGYDSLDLTERRVLYLRYHRGMQVRDLAAHLGVSVGTAQNRVRRAVNGIQDFLGGRKPHADPAEDHIHHENPHNYPDCDLCRDNLWEGGYVGTRTAISNARARAITRNDYKGE